MEDSQGRIWLPGFTGIAILDQSGVPGPLRNRIRDPRNKDGLLTITFRCVTPPEPIDIL
jgi:hypothetical protein